MSVDGIGFAVLCLGIIAAWAIKTKEWFAALNGAKSNIGDLERWNAYHAERADKGCAEIRDLKAELAARDCTVGELKAALEQSRLDGICDREMVAKLYQRLSDAQDAIAELRSMLTASREDAATQTARADAAEGQLRDVVAQVVGLLHGVPDEYVTGAVGAVEGEA